MVFDIKPVLQFRDWDYNLCGCNRIENSLFIIFPAGNPADEQAVLELSYLNANLLPDYARTRATYNYDPRFPRAIFDVTYPGGRQETRSNLEITGWKGPPRIDKWSAEWSPDRNIWLITRP